MAKRIELTLKTDYVPDWTLQDCIREFLSNAKDAELELGAKMAVTHSGTTLTITNEGCTLCQEMLLFGHTTKRQVDGMIGQFGEGSKLAALVAARLGIPLTILTGAEKWVSRVEPSKVFDADVLTFHITNGRKFQDRVQVTLQNISKEVWEDLQKNFLFLCPPDPSETMQDYGIRVMLNPLYKGRIYCKGVFVTLQDKLEYGYDLNDLGIDRDRKMVNPYSLATSIRTAWVELLYRHYDRALPLFRHLLSDNAEDLKSIDPYTATIFGHRVCQDLWDGFVAEHGTLAHPVDDLSDSSELAHFGINGVLLPSSYVAVLQVAGGSVLDLKKKVGESVECYYTYEELTEAERTSILTAVSLVGKVRSLTTNDVKVVSFKRKDIWGLYRAGEILVGRPLLSNPSQTLRCVIHETAHRKGVDGSKAWCFELEEIWRGVYQGITEGFDVVAAQADAELREEGYDTPILYKLLQQLLKDSGRTAHSLRSYPLRPPRNAILSATS